MAAPQPSPDEIKESIDRLFSDEFEPKWMTEAREIDEAMLDESIRAVVDFKWLQAARESEARIIARRCKKAES